MISLELKDLPAALDQCERNIRRAVARGALAGAHRGRALIVKRTPVDMGPLKAGWRVTPGSMDFDGLETTLATLVNDERHIGPVENGARPHPVNPEGWAAIYEWVRRHYRGSKSGGYKLGGTGRMRRQGAGADPNRPFHGSDPEVSAITNAIAWKLRTQGQKPTFFVKRSLEELKAVMAAELERALAHAQDGGS
ncbi:MAG TPA: hypothetical protein VIV56_12120, partial [Gemmatimonadales bacterium]